MRKLFRYLTSFKGPIAFVIGLVFIQSMAELYLPTLMAKIIDTGVVKHDIPFIWKIGGLMIAVALAGTICSVSASYFSARIAMSFGKMLRSKVFTHIEGFSLHEFGTVGTASLITRTTNDIIQIQVVLNMLLRMMISAPLMAIGGIIMAVSVNPGLSIVIVVSVPILIIGIALVIWRGVPLFKKVQVRLDAVNRVLREGLTGVRVIRSFNRIDYEKQRFGQVNALLRDTTIKVNKLIAVLMPFMMLVMNFTTIAIVWFGAVRINAGDMMVGDLMAFMQYAMQIMFSMIMLSMMFVLIPRASASAARINEVLAIHPSIQETPSAHDSSMLGTIEFKDVSFYYPGAEKPALKNLSFKAFPGEVTAIIGGTGSGKSSLLKLIPRFYEPTQGSILIDGVPVKDYPLDALRNKIGLVPQKAVLFTGTVKDNIRFGNEMAADEDVIHAAKVAQAYDFITAMNEGFDSPISQGGTNVSGGQKQRLSIARALVRNPEIYLFDDSFSALDFKTDAKLRKALKEVTEHSTVLLVAQRVSTVMDADRIIVLDEGNVMGIGTHEELLHTNKTYQEIVKSQLSEEEIA
ncbi:multidrug ABC transporter ATP-binding protein [Bacillus sp. FJAT-27916]|uniref:ABC transporter ATP-binding protein n=1 Tax=Bacillaceae TaxID=186817 RepID=UPI000670CA34|nr:ABC transporter ATP-binding protein [Bacillus sp. FJAT-27916]KMY44892.1 multidrug ABC transporter ATP-binding protein [Bacillus sp. FJAT-27916]